MRLLRALTGELLPCGCLVGIYETYDGRVVATIDARGAECDEHRLHAILKWRTVAPDDLPKRRDGER